MTQVNCTLKTSRRTFVANANAFISIEQAKAEFALLLRAVFEKTFRFSSSASVVERFGCGEGVRGAFWNES